MNLHDWIGVTPTRDDFAQQLMRMAEERGFGGWTYEASEFRLRGDERDALVDLGDLFLEYSQAEAADRLDLLEKYLRELRTTSLFSAYRVQRDVLQPKMGDNLFVAIFSMMRQADTRKVYSWCTWAEDTDSLLPRTDIISFYKRPGVGLWVPWDEVERICGHHLRKTDEDPVRYRVKGFPSESEWLQLKQRALPTDDDTFRVGAVLYRPADHPFVDLLADVFGVRPAVRERVFYVYAKLVGDDRVALPPEEDVPAEDVRAGISLARHLGPILDRIVDRGPAPTPVDGWHLFVGWHAGASFDELTEAFDAAGCPARTLDDVLADRRAAWEHMPTRSRLAAYAGDVDGNPFAFVLHGGDNTPEASTVDIGLLLVLLDRLDLDEPELDRLRQVLRPVAAAAAERTG